MLKPARIISVSIVLVLLFTHFTLAQNPLGIGTPEKIITPEGPFASALFWIQQQQKEFYRAMTKALIQIKANGTGGWILVWLSFAYGLLHAAGPGHGKAVISSYMLANEVVLRRGILLSFASSFLQGLTAIVAISCLLLFLRGFGVKSGDLTFYLEVTSYLGITILGAWMLCSKFFKKRPQPHSHLNQNSHDGHTHNLHHNGEHHHSHDDVCNSCGHSHAPAPIMLEGKFGWREAYSAVLAVGLRPCSGALIVLTFAFLNGLYVAGISAVFAMSFGTGIMVSFLATLAVLAKNFVLRLSGATHASDAFYKWVEIIGAGFVFLLGLVLLTASLN